jgi:hypothetical protein
VEPRFKKLPFGISMMTSTRRGVASSITSLDPKEIPMLLDPFAFFCTKEYARRNKSGIGKSDSSL